MHYSCRHTLQCTGKPYLLKAQHSAFNISDSTTIALTVQNLQITSFVPDSTDLVVDSSNKCLAVRTVGMQRCPGFHKNVSFAKWTNQIAEIINFLDSTTLCLTRYAASLLELNWIKSDCRHASFLVPVTSISIRTSWIFRVNQNNFLWYRIELI